MAKNYDDMFPGFGELDVEIPEGFVDASYVNEGRPSFIDHELGLYLAVEFKDPHERNLPIEDGLSRFFMVQMVNKCEGSWQLDEDQVILVESEDYADVLAAIDAVKAGPGNPAP